MTEDFERLREAVQDLGRQVWARRRELLRFIGAVWVAIVIAIVVSEVVW